MMRVPTGSLAVVRLRTLVLALTLALIGLVGPAQAAVLNAVTSGTASLANRRLTESFDAAGRPLPVTSRLPVNGTSIVDAGLYGEWCVELFLDGEAAPIARRPFRLTPP